MTLLSIHPPSTYDQRKIAERTWGIRGLHVVLLKPSKYDDDGYVLRHWRGVLPSNTLACLYALTEDVKRRRALREDLEMTVELLDEAVHKVNVPQIIRHSLGCLKMATEAQFCCPGCGPRSQPTV